MAKKIAGVDVLLMVEIDGQKVAIGGQKGASLTRSAETIDVTDKTSGGWAESIMGLKSWSIECEGLVTLGDQGLEHLHTCFDNGTLIDASIKVGGNEGYSYKGQVLITDFPEEYAQDDAVTYSVTLQGASALVREKNQIVE
ncbi:MULTISPECIES: phage major tail protein, TP901-1 family [Romboutsia]|jgi:TP901-1 family phage major tail protein|uniref:phage major tail protein, TP901-1 family n=1 Tax=Romboutsia TaxID=1501226 RepID=UPI0023F4BDF8|nr:MULTISPECIES: phage major tail protein, TP901-1 family [Romboutsia]